MGTIIESVTKCRFVNVRTCTERKQILLLAFCRFVNVRTCTERKQILLLTFGLTKKVEDLDREVPGLIPTIGWQFAVG